MRSTTGMAFGIAALFLTMEPSLACRGPTFETSTVLDRLPDTALSEDVVARIEIIEALKPPWQTPDVVWNDTPWARVRVVEAIKGVQQDQTFTVDTRGSSCDQRIPLGDPQFDTYRLNWRPYIAGRFVRIGSEVVFRGAWKREPRTGEYLRAW